MRCRILYRFSRDRKALEQYWLPLSEWNIRPSAGRARSRAILRAFITSSLIILLLDACPTTSLVHRSLTMAVYNHPSSVQWQVMSLIYTVFGSDASNF